MTLPEALEEMSPELRQFDSMRLAPLVWWAVLLYRDVLERAMLARPTIATYFTLADVGLHHRYLSGGQSTAG